MSERIEQAYQEYLKRQSRESDPDGKFDNARRWYPSVTEHQVCCSSVRIPSRVYPYSLMLHCRTATHVANLYGIVPKVLRSHIAKTARYNKPAETAPTDLCLTCGASWACEHMPTAGKDFNLRPIADSNADMDRHLGPRVFAYGGIQ